MLKNKFPYRHARMVGKNYHCQGKMLFCLEVNYKVSRSTTGPNLKPLHHFFLVCITNVKLLLHTCYERCTPRISCGWQIMICAILCRTIMNRTSKCVDIMCRWSITMFVYGEMALRSNHAFRYKYATIQKCRGLLTPKGSRTHNNTSRICYKVLFGRLDS